MPGEWVRVASVSDVGKSEVIGVRVGDRDVALCRTRDGALHATDNVCTHEYARLSDGWLEDDELECPLHGGKFDVRDGKALCPPVEADIEVFEVKTEGRDIFVRVP